MQAAVEDRLYSGGMTLTSISNATFTTGTLGATCTPIIGLWNPANSNRYLVVLQAILGVTITALQATGGGPFVWASSIGNAAISTGIVPTNRRTLAAAGSVGKVYAGTALTGLTNNLAVIAGSALIGGSASNAAFLATAVAMQAAQGGVSVENFDGSIIVPPGGVLALLATTTPVAHSAASAILFEEVQALI
jgi:hypothetical protein